jgi:hypothetical protein
MVYGRHLLVSCRAKAFFTSVRGLMWCLVNKPLEEKKNGKFVFIENDKKANKKL